MLRIGEEVVTADQSDHQRRVDAVEFIDRTVLNVIALLDELRGNTEPPLIVREEVRHQPWSDHLNESLRMVDIVDAQVPKRHGPIIVRALVVRRDADAETDREVHARRRLGFGAGALGARRLGQSEVGAEQSAEGGAGRRGEQGTHAWLPFSGDSSDAGPQVRRRAVPAPEQECKRALRGRSPSSLSP